MASFIRHRNGTYYVVFFKQGKRIWRSLQTRDRVAAYKLFLQQVEGDSRPPSLTLRQSQDEFLAFAATNFSGGTIAIYKNTFGHFLRFLSDRPLGEISTRDIDLYKGMRFKVVSPTTVNLELRALRAFFNRLKAWDQIAKNPCDGVKTIRICDTVRPFLSKEELSNLLNHTSGTQLHDIILLAAMTGLRKGEVLNLTWDDVDLQRGVLLIRSSISYRTKGGKMRVVPLNRTVSDLLKNLPKSSGPIFPGDRGGAYNHDFLSKRFKRAVIGAGLDSRLHFHSLRHTFASLLVRDGVPLYHVQKLLGHSSARVTEIYAHLGQAELGSSVEKLSLSI